MFSICMKQDFTQNNSPMPNTPPEPTTIPYPFHIISSEGYRRILWNFRLDMLYLQEWTGSYWKETLNMSVDDYNRISKTL